MKCAQSEVNVIAELYCNCLETISHFTALQSLHLLKCETIYKIDHSKNELSHHSCSLYGLYSETSQSLFNHTLLLRLCCHLFYFFLWVRILRAYSWFCVHHFWWCWGNIWNAEFEPGQLLCKEGTLLTVLSYWPLICSYSDYLALKCPLI